MARVLHVVMGDCWGEFSGYGSRGLYLELRGRPPAYNTRTRRWTAQLQTARDLVALAESRGFDVVVTGATSVDLEAAAGNTPEPVATPESEGLLLW